VVERAKQVEAIRRGELEITDLNRQYLDEGLLRVNLMGRGMAGWITGHRDSRMRRQLSSAPGAPATRANALAVQNVGLAAWGDV